MRLRVLDRYLLGTFLRIFGLVALSAPLLFVLADITERLDVDLARGVTAAATFSWYVGQFPIYLTWSLPIAALVATLFTLQPLARHGELHAMLASGICIHRLFRPLLLCGVAASLLGIGILETAPRLGRGPSSEAPWAQQSGRTERMDFAYLTDAGEILSVQRLDVGAGGQMHGVVLRSASNDQSGAVQYIVAKDAIWVDGRGWVLRDGRLWHVASDGSQTSTAFERLVHPALTERPGDFLAVPPMDLAGMTFGQLRRLANRLGRSGAPTAYPRTKQWERVMIPLTILAIIMFAARRATMGGYEEGQLGIALSLVPTIVYLALRAG